MMLEYAENVLVFYLCVYVCRVWDPTRRSTTAHTEVASSLLSLDWVPQSESLVCKAGIKKKNIGGGQIVYAGICLCVTSAAHVCAHSDTTGDGWRCGEAV